MLIRELLIAVARAPGGLHELVWQPGCLALVGDGELPVVNKYEIHVFIFFFLTHIYFCANVGKVMHIYSIVKCWCVYYFYVLL